MDKQTVQEWLTWSFSPSISAIIITLLVSLLLPLLIHYYLYRSGVSTNIPAFLIAGPSGAGKTTLLTCLHGASPKPTHTSQAPHTVAAKLPSSITAKSSIYRAADDPSKERERQLEVIDTPGHGKLRHHAFAALASTKTLRGLVFVVDSAALSSAAGLTEAATYLHDMLLALQKRHSSGKTSKGPAAIPVLVAANKLDLFTALPPQLVKSKLQDEISKIRSTRAKGLLDSGAGGEGEDGAGAGDEDYEWLGEGGEGAFDFKQMEESDVEVVVLGGNMTGGEPQLDQWWKWIAQHM